MNEHTKAVLQAFFVTLLWAMSWVLIKVGLQDMPALTFAGLRYFLAFLCLLPLAARRGELTAPRTLPRAAWGQLLLLGFVYYTVTQGAQFVALSLLPAITTSLVLSFTPIVVALLAGLLLRERTTLWQWLGIAITVAGALLYFWPVNIPAGQVVGLIIIFVGMFANVISALMGRALNRARLLPPLSITLVSMGFGATLLLVAGVWVQGMPAFTWRGWLIIIWLAVIHTAFAFTLWNHTLRTLPAVESSIINNTLVIQIPALAVIFLGETMNARQVGGLLAVVVGTLIVQLRRHPQATRS
ncbi:MAG: DMT family transporter [Anaerolineales bacterium]|nr:DMT family transporter [Anaerolineales bacterium]